MTSLITFENKRDISCWPSQQGCEKMVKQKIEKIEKREERKGKLKKISPKVKN